MSVTLPFHRNQSVANEHTEVLHVSLGVQVLQVCGPTVSMRLAYYRLRRNQQTVILHAHLQGARSGMRNVSVVVTVDQRTASGTEVLDAGSIRLKSAALHWDSGSNASQPIEVTLPAVSCLASLGVGALALRAGKRHCRMLTMHLLVLAMRTLSTKQYGTMPRFYNVL